MQVRTNLCLFVGVCYNAIKAQTILYLFVFEISVSNHENGLLTCESFAFNWQWKKNWIDNISYSYV